MRFPQADLNPLRGEYTGVGRWMDVANPDRVEVVEWSAFVDLDGRLVFAGAVENVGEEQFSLVDVVVRFYAEDGALVEVVNGAVSGRWVKPEARSPFRVDTYLPADAGFGRYADVCFVVD
ncbi:MAG: FxLYD domain-containing protein [Caldilineaceae bacterium]|nr:FxLYD domain-containing protein [Caldilineaceae bacterium]